MAVIEGFRVQNFGVLQDVGLGICSIYPDAESLSPMTAVIGKNGVGKSTLFDAFGFLADALKFGVEEACDSRGRGGFRRLRSQGRSGPVQYEVVYREHGNASPIIYTLAIDKDATGRPFVSREQLTQSPERQSSGHSSTYLMVRVRGRFRLGRRCRRWRWQETTLGRSTMPHRAGRKGRRSSILRARATSQSRRWAR